MKKKTNRNLLVAVGAGVLGVLAGVAGMFLSKEENRDKVKTAVDSAVKKGKTQVLKAKKKLAKRK